MANMEEVHAGVEEQPIGWECNAATTAYEASITMQGAALRQAVKDAKDAYIRALHGFITEVDIMIGLGVDYSDLPSIPKFAAHDCIVFTSQEILTRIKDFDTNRAFTVSLLYYFLGCFSKNTIGLYL
jgi:hypothetical protein